MGRRIVAAAASLALLVAAGTALLWGAHLAIGYLWSGTPSSSGAGTETAPIPGDLSAAERALVEAVARVKPAVVSINVSTKIPGRRIEHPFADDPFFRDFFGRHFRFEIPPREEHGLGSGFIISADGFILTNWHVVGAADEIQVRLADGRIFDGKVVGSDRSTDVALVKIEAENLPVAPLGRSSGLAVGQFVFAVGTPFAADLAQTVTFGIVSGTGRSRGIAGIEDFIQTDAAVNPGNSGGPLCDLRGEVVGINTAIVPATAGGNSLQGERVYAGVSFAIPIDLARRVADDIRETGSFRRGYLGVRMRSVRPDEIEALGLSRVHGAVVEAVEDGSPAKRAGIEVGDVIVRVNGTEVEDSRNLQALIAGIRPGSRVDVVVLRAKSERTLTVEIGTFSAGGEGSARLGVRVEPLDASLAARLGIGGAGVQIVEVEAESPAGEKGLEAGDVILQANRKPVASAADLDAILGGAESALLLLWDHRTGRTLWIEIPLR